jgi:N-acetylglucosamine-6-sulfatase
MLLAALAGALSIVLAALAPSPSQAAARQPNIVMVVTDDQTLAEMNPRVMPITSGLFADGTAFENSITVSPSCCPSRAAFFSGEYPHNNGVLSNDPGYPALKGRANLLPTWMQQAGYRTAHFGKFLNHFGSVGGYTETPPGWDRWYTTINYRYFDYRVVSDGRIKHYGERPRDYMTRRITGAATKYIRSHAGGTKPVYVQIDHFAPHAEQAATPGRCTEAAQPDPDDAGLYLDEPLPQSGLDPAQRSFNEEDTSDKSPAIANRPPLGDFVIGKVTRRYRCQLAALAGVDRSMGEVESALRDAGALRNTAIFFTSDNGFFHGEHRLPNNKGLPYEEGVRVPLLARLPASMADAAPARIDEPVGNIDLAPTFLDLAGDAAPCNAAGKCRRLDGRSLLGLLQSDPSGWPDDRKLLVEQGRIQYFCAPYTAIWGPSEMLAQFPTGDGSGNCSIETEHYEMDEDPMQLENLFPADPATQEFARQRNLADRLEGMKSCSGIEGREPPLRRVPFCD